MRLLRLLLKTVSALVAVVLLAAMVFIAWHWAPDRPLSDLTDRWAPPPSQFAEIAGMPVHYRDEGPRDAGIDAPPPLVLLHGTSDSLHAWDGWAAALAPTRRVIRFDLPGFGLTGPPADDDLTMERYREVLFALLDRLEVPRAILAGNSFGGRVAWTSAIHAPERVAGLILVSASGLVSEPVEVPAGFALAGLPGVREALRNTLPRFLVRMSLESVYGDPARLTEAEVDRFYEITLREGNRDALIGRFRMSPAGPDVDRIAEIAVPTLILWGDADRLIPPDAAERWGAAVAGSEVVVLQGVGHVPHVESPEASAAAALDFLNRRF
ncbi:MAG: alpha/beta fold hydrolase [Pseudomonadota bacterium]